MNPARRRKGALRAKKIWAAWARWGLVPADEREDKREFGILMRTRRQVSNCLNGNPRRHFGQRTIQELRAMQEEE